MIQKYDFGFIVGRFQPLHDGHVALINEALRLNEKVVIFVGSAGEPSSLKNPFTYEERKQLIVSNFKSEVEDNRIVIRPLPDYQYRDDKWEENLSKKVMEFLPFERRDYSWVFSDKDEETTKYNKSISLPRNCHRIPVKTHKEINATDIREAFYNGGLVSSLPNISEETRRFLLPFKDTPRYSSLRKEREATKEYVDSWKGTPFPVLFNAVDGLIVWRDSWNRPHVLLVTRKSDIGNGKYALPGGYLDVTEKILDGAKREVLEETGMVVDNTFSLQQVRVFDEVNRSTRGRMITFVHHWEVSGRYPPKFNPEGQDDASSAFFLPVDEFHANKHKFFSDHFGIVASIVPEVDQFQ